MDFPIPRATNAKRTSNVIPQQFLFMMNSQFMIDRAKALASRLEAPVAEGGGTKPTPESQVEHAYALLYGRKPAEREATVGTVFLKGPVSEGTPLNRLQQYCQVLLSANEFMYIR